MALLDELDMSKITMSAEEIERLGGIIKQPQPMSNYRQLASNGWVQVEGYQLFELARQEYGGNNCIFAVGLVEGYPPDTHYLWIEKDSAEPTILFFRTDELAAIAWLCSGALWSHLIEDVKN